MEFIITALGQGLAPGIIVAIYLIVIRIIDTKKEKNKTQVSTELLQSINTISKYIIDNNKNIIDTDKEKCKIAINDSMSNFSLKLIQFVQQTILNNHIDINKENIVQNTHNIVTSEFYTVFSTLSLYIINNKKVSEHLDDSLIKDIETDIIGVIYNNSMTNEDKINSFTNKIDIKLSAQVVHLTNKVLK